MLCHKMGLPGHDLWSLGDLYVVSRQAFKAWRTALPFLGGNSLSLSSRNLLKLLLAFLKAEE